MEMPVLWVVSISKDFGALEAVRNLSFGMRGG